MCLNCLHIAIDILDYTYTGLNEIQPCSPVCLIEFSDQHLG